MKKMLRSMFVTVFAVFCVAFMCRLPEVQAAPSADYFQGKKVSILGDSISTFTGIIPADYNIYYPESGDITVPELTWWGQVMGNTGMQLCANASSANTNVTGNSLDLSGSAPACSTRRIVDLMGKDGSMPDVIIVYMGINDFSRSREPGNFVAPSAQVDGEVMVFSDAYELMLQKIKIIYPNAEIYCCTLPDRHCFDGCGQEIPVNNIGKHISDYNMQIMAVASAYGAKIIDLATFSGLNWTNLSLFTNDGIHWNIHGATLIGNCVTVSLYQ